MSLTLDDVVTAARDRHPAFHKTRAPNIVCARFATDFQNSLIALAADRDSRYLAQRVSIALAFDAGNVPGVAGAGAGGLPGSVSETGDFTADQSTAGLLIEARLESEDGAGITQADVPVTTATACVVNAAVTRTIDADIGAILVVVAGKGYGQQRAVLDNTATQWTVYDGVNGAPLDPIPDSTSVVRIVDPAYLSSGEQAVVTALPATRTRYGYLTKLDATGTPYIDWGAPVVTQVSDGIPILPARAIVGGLARTSDGNTQELVFTSPGRRWDPPDFPAVFVMGQNLHLCGDQTDWTDWASLEIEYIPLAQAFARLTDVFLVPDAAKECLVAALAAFIAQRIAGMADVVIDPRPYQAAAAATLQTYLGSLRLTRRARRGVFREVAY